MAIPATRCSDGVTNMASGSAGKQQTEPDPKMLELPTCPLTHSVLHYDRERQELVSRVARLAFPVRDGIPVMLASEARQLEADES